MSDSLWAHGPQFAGFLCPWDFWDKNTGVGCCFLSRGSSQIRDRIPVSCVGRQILYYWATRKAHILPYLMLHPSTTITTSVFTDQSWVTTVPSPWWEPREMVYSISSHQSNVGFSLASWHRKLHFVTHLSVLRDFKIIKEHYSRWQLLLSAVLLVLLLVGCPWISDDDSLLLQV